MDKAGDHTLIIIPAYNEEGPIYRVVQQILREGWEHVLVVDDGSTDNTAYEAQRAGATILHHRIKRGVGAATQTGLSYALKYDFQQVITMDGDGQHAATDLKSVIAPIEAGDADLVIGNRFMKGDNDIPRARQVFNGIGNLLTFLISWRWVHDSQSGFKAFNRRALESIEIHLEGYEFCSEVIIKAVQEKLRIIEVPITVYYTKTHKTKGQDLFNGVRTAFNLFFGFIFKN